MTPRAHRCWLLLVVAALAACGSETPAPPATSEHDADALRIVTLAPALTQMVVDLGVGDQIVGISEHDAAAPPPAEPGATLPVVGNFLDVDTERLLSVRPTHVVMMVAKEGAPQRLVQLADAHGFRLVAYPYPRNMQSLLQILSPTGEHTLPGLGELLNRAERAADLRQRMERFFAALERLTGAGERPEVLIIIGANPLMAEGPGTVHNELLAYAGGLNAARSATVTAPTYDREALLAMDPDVVLLLTGGGMGDTGEGALPELRELPITATKEGRIVPLRDPLRALPSTALPRVAAEMARAIHPPLAPEIDKLLAEHGFAPAPSPDGEPATR